jgi:hypothetical protein
MMKALACVFLGIVIALPIIYWLHPLNNGAVTLVVVMSVSVVSFVYWVIWGRKS